MSLRWSFLVVVGLFACGGHSGNGSDANGGPTDSSGPQDGPGEDAGSGCGLLTCASQNAACGLIGDGCGGTIDCGSCPTGETCGGGGVHFQCGSGGGSGSGSACTPVTCQSAGADCGIISDGCGSTIDCGSSCPAGEVCGGGSAANVCATPPCVGPLCTEVNACTNMPQTTISGTVTAPGHPNVSPWTNWTPDPIYGALVYVPNGSAGAPTYGVTAFSSGVSCDTCSSEVTGSPMVSAVTGTDGTFKLSNVPCGTNIPLVIQLGRWRRMITIPNVACCANTALTNDQTHLPRVHTTATTGDVYDDIPLMAFDTGSVDTLHCVLRKIGIDDSEFTNPSGTGRVHFYQDNGARINSSTPAASTLYDSQTELDKYDEVLFECVGKQANKTATEQTNLINYANAGGRVYATHYSYVWLTNMNSSIMGNTTGPDPFDQTATWDVEQNVGNDNSSLGVVDTTLQGDAGTQTRRIAFANWLKQVGATSTVGQITVDVVRHDFDAVSSTPGTMSGTPAQLWLKTTDLFTGPLHYTFDTPINYSTPPTTQCGRVLFSDFHVSNASVSTKTNFPSECTAGAMTAQEQTLEFMLFDLASCVGTQTISCTPKTCADFGYACGESGDGCADGMVLQCGSCGNNQTCVNGQCQMGTMCTPLTCMDVGAQCGIIGDGCGSTVDCGQCPMGQVCGGNGQANQCGGVIQ